MGFAEELVKNRKAMELTQEELAEKCSISRQAVAKWEKGESLPDVYTIARLAKLFCVSIEELIFSKNAAVLENKTYYVRAMVEDDKCNFMKILREHKFIGAVIKTMDSEVEKMGRNVAEDEFWKVYFKEDSSFVICLHDSQEMVGYFYVESPETSAPQMSFQFRQEFSYNKDMLEVTRDFMRMLYDKYQMKGIFVHINSDLEKEIFTELGYDNIGEEVMVILPI